jgi:hypothetical protein
MTKEEILAEIKRTTELNNGKPLGKIRFEKETGIRESDWIGRYWVKWSEAIAEAGFKPNRMQVAYSKDYLLESYATLITKLQHVPTNAEVRLTASQDSTFPSHNTFSRFGSKLSLLNAVYEYCQKNPEYSSIVGLVRDSANSLNKAKKRKPEEKDDSAGYVYLIKFGEVYKIGNSNNVERRFREIKTQMPYEGKIVHNISTGDPEGIERYWHEFFREKRLKGEWFQLSADDVIYFKKRKIM